MDLKPKSSDKHNAGDNFPVPSNDSVPTKNQPPALPSSLAAKCRSRKVYPSDEPPITLSLPFFPVPGEIRRMRHRYVEIETRTRANVFRALRRNRIAESIAPGWLTTIEDERVQAILEIEEAMSTSPSKEDLIATLHSLFTEKLAIATTKGEICDIINKIESSARGLSFSRFLFAFANPQYAKKVGIISKRMIKKKLNCEELIGDSYDVEEEEEGEVVGEEDDGLNGSSKARSKPRSKASSRPRSELADETGYTEREKILYTGLLIVQMYKTLKKIESIYFQDWIPLSPGREAKLLSRFGFGTDSGTKKLRMSEWDRTLPSFPSLSPYATSIPFVTSRWNILKPNAEERKSHNELARIHRMHLLIEPPDVDKKTGIPLWQPIRVMENRYRIKRILEHLAYEGDCVALLPNIQFLIHLSDTFINKLEEITMNPLRRPVSDNAKIYAGNEELCIALEARNLYRPFGLPRQIARLKYLISYTDGLHLRKITKHIQSKHWEVVTTEMKKFREKCWDWMHADRISPRMLPGFKHAFNSYIPSTPDLPIYHQHNPNSV